MDMLSLIGVILAFVAILGGNMLEGGTLQSLIDLPAAVIVFGGTLAATTLQTSRETLVRSVRMLGWVFAPPSQTMEEGINKVVDWSLRSRREGLLGLEKMAEQEADPFARKGLQMLVDGSEPDLIRDTLEIDLESREHRDVEASRVYEAMGGYAPTIGIIGAVMGLIQVLTHLDDPDAIGVGIATAFVATIYGIAIANLFFFPIANKLRAIVRRRVRYEEMLIEGLLAVLEGQNPRSIHFRMRGFSH